MPQFLTTAGTSHTIEDIIIKAKFELVLITPYLKLSRILFERLTDASHRGVRIQVVYGKSELQHSERRQLDSLAGIELLFLENLHAKCYYNESILIVSSMNLYEFSEKNNREMGIVLTRRDDAECFADALAEAQSIIKAAGGVRSTSLAPTSPILLSDTQAQSQTTNKQEYDEEVMVQMLFAALKQAEPGRQFSIESDSYFGRTDKFYYTIHAQDYPRKGLSFNFCNSFRFDFSESEDFQNVKSTQRSEIERRLDSSYRYYWNRNVVQVYAASNYKRVDEEATAAYFLKAIISIAEVLQTPPPATRPAKKFAI